MAVLFFLEHEARVFGGSDLDHVAERVDLLGDRAAGGFGPARFPRFAAGFEAEVAAPSAPHAYRSPFARLASVCIDPPAISTTGEPGSSSARTGNGLGVVVPLPSWPLRFSPQASTSSPPARTA